MTAVRWCTNELLSYIKSTPRSLLRIPIVNVRSKLGDVAMVLSFENRMRSGGNAHFSAVDIIKAVIMAEIVKAFTISAMITAFIMSTAEKCALPPDLIRFSNDNTMATSPNLLRTFTMGILSNDRGVDLMYDSSSLVHQRTAVIH